MTNLKSVMKTLCLTQTHQVQGYLMSRKCTRKMCHSQEKTVLNFGTTIKLHSFLLFWLFSGRRDIQASRPLDHSCLTTILVLAQGQRWMIAIISLHPLSKVSKKKRMWEKREGKQRRKKKSTFPGNIRLDCSCFTVSLYNAKADAGYVERENTCFPAVLTSCSQSLQDSAATNHYSSGHERLPSLKQQLKWTLSLSHGTNFPMSVWQTTSKTCRVTHFNIPKIPLFFVAATELQQPFCAVKNIPVTEDTF